MSEQASQTSQTSQTSQASQTSQTSQASGPSSAIPGVRFRQLDVHPDERGSFRETYRQSWFAPDVRFVQGNASMSLPNVLRGMHYHHHQDDYWVVLQGTATLALVDLRGLRDRGPAQPRRVEPQRVEVCSLRPGASVYIPSGVAHGFYAHEHLLLTYLVTQYYDGKDEFGVAWNDPDLAIAWPCAQPILSPRDAANPRLVDIDPAYLPR